MSLKMDDSATVLTLNLSTEFGKRWNPLVGSVHLRGSKGVWGEQQKENFNRNPVQA